MNETEYALLFNQSQTVLNSSSYVYWSIGLLICGILAIVTNPLILWTIWRQNSLHSGCFFLIGQMALADFIVGLSLTITTLKRLIRIHFYLAEIIPQLQCTFEMLPMYSSQSASLVFALMLGIERFLGAAMPVLFKTIQWKISYGLSIITWLFVILDSFSMFAGVSSSKLILFCTLTTALTGDFESLQEKVKNIITIAIIVAYASVFITLSLQLQMAKRQNEQSLVTMKKALQIKVARMLIVMATVYLLLQLATRIALDALLSLSIEERTQIAPYLRMLININSGIHFFIYISMSTDFKEAFKKSFGCKNKLIIFGSSEDERQPRSLDGQRTGQPLLAAADQFELTPSVKNM